MKLIVLISVLIMKNEPSKPKMLILYNKAAYLKGLKIYIQFYWYLVIFLPTVFFKSKFRQVNETYFDLYIEKYLI